VFGAEAFFLPGLGVTAIAAASAGFLEHHSVALMVAALEALHADDAACIGSAVKALNNRIFSRNYFGAD
jgi:hypothetical protein